MAVYIVPRQHAGCSWDTRSFQAMTYGFRAINQGGYDQVDGEYASYYLQAEGTEFTVTPPGVPGRVNLITLPSGLSFSDCLLFVRIPADGLSIRLDYMTDSQAGVQIQEGGRRAVADLPYEWRVYGPAVVLDEESNEFGIKVMNANSGVVFDSRGKFLRISHFSHLTISENTPPRQIEGYGISAWISLSGTGRQTGYRRQDGLAPFAVMKTGFQSIDGQLFLSNIQSSSVINRYPANPNPTTTPILIMEDYM